MSLVREPLDVELKSNAVGVSHPNEDGISRQKIIRRMGIGNPVSLVREPYSPYDPNQVGLFVESRERATLGELVKIGHLERSLAARIAPEMDRGIRWGAFVGDLPGRTTKGVVLMIGRVKADSEAVAEVPIALTPLTPLTPEPLNMEEAFATFNQAEAAQKGAAEAQAAASEVLAAAQQAKEQADGELATACSGARSATQALIAALQAYDGSLGA